MEKEERSLSPQSIEFTYYRFSLFSQQVCFLFHYILICFVETAVSSQHSTSEDHK